MGTMPGALTPQQVNSWPAANSASLDINGGRVPTSTDAERRSAFLQLARDRLQQCINATQHQADQMMEDLNFSYPEDPNGQWDPTVLQKRSGQGRPCLTINRIQSFLMHVINNMRQARPAIKIIPAGDAGADKDMAEVRQGLIRYIEQNSRADISYDNAFEWMCMTGLGWLRIVDDWSGPRSMDKDLFIRWVSNPFAVYADPFCQQPDWSDMKFAFITEDMSRREFVAKYGDRYDASDLNNFRSIGDQRSAWVTGEKVRVAEYFHVEYVNEVLCEIGDGEQENTVLFSELKESALGSGYFLDDNAEGDRVLMYQGSDGEPLEIGRTRDTKIPEVRWALITGLDIIKERKWKGQYIPLIPVIGNQVRKGGEILISGMVRYAREAQRMYNYFYSSAVEAVALAPKSPFVAAVDQVPDGLMPEWQNANSEPTAILRYKHVFNEQGSAQVPPPQRQQAEPPIAAFVNLLSICDQMLKSVFSIYEASLGQRGPQESGIAINARKVESDTGTYNWGDNFIRALRLLGIMLEDLLPHYYNTPGRVFQIIREDDTQKEIRINQEFSDNGEKKKFDLAKGGKYAVVVSTGPSYQTRRQEAAESMLNLFAKYPAGLQACAHILVKELDFVGADKIAAQLEKILPEPLREQDPDAPPIPDGVKAMLSQFQQQVQGLTQALHEALDKKELERMKEEFALLREQLKQETTLAVAQLKVGSDEAKFMNDKLFGELEWIKNTLAQQLTQPSSAPSVPPAPTSSAVTPTGSDNSSVGGA